MKKIENIAIIGAGAMGAQIAALAAEAGYNVKIRDIEERFLERGRQTISEIYDKRISRGRLTEQAKNDYMGRLTFLIDLKETVKDADFIIEAVTEIMDLKKSLLKEITASCPPDTVYATNTSSLSITEMSAAARRPELVIGTHYFNPPSRMTLLEIVKGDKTGQEAVEIAEQLAIAMKRDVVHVKDVPGFVANRIFYSMSGEADWALAQGEAKSAFEVDSAIKYRLGLPMGILELQDTLAGGSIDTEYHVMEYFAETMGKSYGPPPLLSKLFKENNLGKKTGKGYYDWSGGRTNEIPVGAGANFDPLRVLATAINEAAKLIEMEATTREYIDKAVLLGLNYPRGILRMADSIGLDKVVRELDRLYEKYHKEDRYKASSVLTNLVKQKKLGRKTGEGFYTYGPGEYEFVKLDVNREKKLAKLVLNRIYRDNALNKDFLAEIKMALDELEENPDVCCIVITGAGAHFSSGADVATITSGQIDASFKFNEAAEEVFTGIEAYGKPAIAAVNGPAAGAGLELALACDIRIMNKTAAVRLAETGAGTVRRLSRLVGSERAGELAGSIDAEKALAWGLVNFIVEPKDFTTAVDDIAVNYRRPAKSAGK